MMMMMGETWTGLGSTVAGIMFVSAMFRQYFPGQLRDLLQGYASQLMKILNPNMQITFNERSGGRFSRNEAYTAIEGYLSTHSSTQAKRLKADLTTDSSKLLLNLDNHEEITDHFHGVELRWSTPVEITKDHDGLIEEKRSFNLSFDKKHRQLVINDYLNHVIEGGKAVVVSNRQRRLYSNDAESWASPWTYVAFQHRATFQNLAMDPLKKKQIVDDLITFSNSKDYYAKIGKAWKRGYLLYGPPGTGKTTMIAAMANLLNFDIYDLELTAVKNNTKLRKLLIETSSKSIIVIEDIDCSLDLTGNRKKEKDSDSDSDSYSDSGSDSESDFEEEGNNTRRGSKVTLSGLLNFIDGLWSSCGEERIIVFTTNHKEKLDPALIRSGRMDMHIEMSYCCFESFKVLAKNYLDIDSHPLFDTIRGLLEETQITPADVAENLMPKTIKGDAKTSLENLIRFLQTARDKKKVELASDKKVGKEEKDNKKSLFRWYSRLSSRKKRNRRGYNF